MVGWTEKTIILVVICNQQFRGAILLMVFDLQGLVDLYIYLDLLKVVGTKNIFPKWYFNCDLAR